MLAMQASNLEQQERLFKKQIRLGLREILQQEMSFYISAFHNINTCGSVLAGFAFSGLLLTPYDGREEDSSKTPSNLSQSQSKRLSIIFNGACACTCCLSLLTLIYANYLGLFSTRLALRGGESAVEHTVTRLRREYKVVLHLLTASVLTFVLTIPVLAFYKMQKTDVIFVTSISIPSFILVVYLYNRARTLFYLNKDDRFAKSRGSGMGQTKGKTIDLAGSWADSDTSFHKHELRKSLIDDDEDEYDDHYGNGNGPRESSSHHPHALFHSHHGSGRGSGKRNGFGWGHMDFNHSGRYSEAYSETPSVGPRYSKQFLDDNMAYGSGDHNKSSNHSGTGGGGGGGRNSTGGYSSSGGHKKHHPDYYRGYVEGSLSARPVEEEKADYLRGFVEGSLTSAPQGYGPQYNDQPYNDDDDENTKSRNSARFGRSWGTFTSSVYKRGASMQSKTDDDLRYTTDVSSKRNSGYNGSRSSIDVSRRKGYFRNMFK
mmetsp:Transcript_44737/g.57297  ORF Transcript_44737/g.57297 Transcript_44737/m.57297 type:complete len:487 (+) Transcript_44737:95-1555(+)